MKKKHSALLQYLMDHPQTITSKELATQLQISQRSVKNYVMEINLLTHDRAILSSKAGYSINTNIARELLHKEQTQIPQTWEERASYIIKQLVFEHTSFLDIYTLCEQLYVGYSTLKADIARMNKAYTNFNVQFITENECLKIIGEEKSVRRLISYTIQEETSNQMMDISLLKESFHSVSIQDIANIIQSTFHKYSYYMNDFSYINLLLHFVIIIDRLVEGNRMEKAVDEFPIESAHEKALVYELCTKLEERFSIFIDHAERFEIYMLFKTNANYTLSDSQETLRKVVGDDILSLTESIVEKINTEYYMDLGSEGFLTPFALHIKNLILRAQNGRFTKNPMAESIKTSCPTVYDIAIFVSLELMHRYHFKINEDEVGFLALHIGAEIERQKTNEAKIQCVLLCPEYMGITQALYNQLLINFGNQINIIKTTSYESDLEALEYDFLLTTMKLSRPYHHPVCNIPPFSGQLNLSFMMEAIEKYRASKKNYILMKNFHYFFSKNLFVANPKATTRDEVIHLLTQQMLKQEFVEPDFEDKVFIREKAASTAFGNIAIPHSMEMQALKTCIGVAISKKGFYWNQQIVHIVLLIAINKADKQTFKELYEALVMLFSDEQMIQLIKECTSFADFEEYLHSCITYDKEES